MLDGGFQTRDCRFTVLGLPQIRVCFVWFLTNLVLDKLFLRAVSFWRPFVSFTLADISEIL